jgi:hypothetical protein
MIVTDQPASTGCKLADADYQLYADTAAFSTGDMYHLASKRAVSQAMQVMPTMYMDAKVAERYYADCSNGQSFYVPVDSHTASMTVTVKGNIPVMAFYEPQGTRWQSGDDLLNDVNVKVSQAITPCPDGWQMWGYACYKGYPEGDNWVSAQTTCSSQGGHLANVLNGDKQGFLNYNIHGLDIWTGLNDRAQEGSFMWDGPVPLALDNFYTNWAPGEPALSNIKDCMAIMHPIQNGTIGDPRWYMRDCSETRAFVCQRHAFDFNNNRIPAGYWNVYVQTRDSGQPNGKACRVIAHVQTDLQVFPGFAATQFDDFPQPAPTSASTNYIVASVGSGMGTTHIDFIDLLSFNGTTTLGENFVVQRAQCAYPFVTKQPLQCPAKAFAMSFYGHDENSYTFSRVRDAYCLASIKEFVTYLGHDRT